MNKKFIKLYNLKSLAKCLQVGEGVLLYMKDNHHKHYQFGSVINNGKVRYIHMADDRLKPLLEKIDTKILSRFPFPKTFKNIGGSPKSNALVHANKDELIKIDIEHFYPSVNRKRVERAFLSVEGITASVAKYLSMVTTIKEPNHLPLGFPTSPKIAALVMLPLEHRLHALQAKYPEIEIGISIWADDISISGKQGLLKFKHLLRKIIEESGFKVNEKKFIVAQRIKPHHNFVVTGVALNKKITIPKNKKGEIENIIRVLIKYSPSKYLEAKNIEPSKHALIKLKQMLEGKINYVHDVDPSLAEFYKQRAENIHWE